MRRSPRSAAAAADPAESPTKRARSDGASRRDPPAPPPPDASLLSRPVCRSWGRAEWAAWGADEDAHFQRCNARERRPPQYDAWGGRFHDYLDQKVAAVAWAEPDEITLRICVKSSDGGEDADVEEVAVETLRRDEPQTFLSIIDAVCASRSLDRDAYRWKLEILPRDPGREPRSRARPLEKPITVPTTMTIPDRCDLLREEDGPCFSRLWTPQDPRLWEGETSFGRRLIATPKAVPTAPPPEPSYDKLKCPPPMGDASPEVWNAWHKENSMGCWKFWKQKNEAVEYRCPAVWPLRLEGVTHAVTVDAAADATLASSVAAFAAAAEAAGHDPVDPAELLVKEGDEVLDTRTTTTRSLFYGARKEPKTLQVVFRDGKKTEAALLKKHGEVPEGYVSFSGTGYLLEDTEAPWLVSEAHGVAAFNAVITEAMDVYEGTDFSWKNGTVSYDPVARWWEMCELLRKQISKATRKPKGGWTRENCEHALDRLTGVLLCTRINDAWQNDARGKIMFWDPECRKETVGIMRRMDEVAVKLIAAANTLLADEEEATVPEGLLGLPRVLDQTKRLLVKLQEDYKGYSTPGYDHHKGYLAFSKAIPLMG